jgi:hypothetical protein
LNDSELCKHLYTSEQKIKWWGYGEWVEEPDVLKFKYKNFECAIVRTCKPDGPDHIFGGHLCGYVCLPDTHVYFKKNYSDIDIDVHGGLTFSEMAGVGKYWIGFDCSHSGDYTPSTEKLKKESNFIDLFPIPKEYLKYSIFNLTYKNIDFCVQECKSMVDQLCENDCKVDEHN